MKAVRITTAGEYEEIEVEDESRVLAKAIGADWIERVNPVGLRGSHIVMIVDEEGALKKGVQINPAGCALYGSQIHGQWIYGDLLLVGEHLTLEGAIWADFSVADHISRVDRAKQLVEAAARGML